MQGFIFTANPSRVIFGVDSLKELPAEVRRLAKNETTALKALVLCTPEQRESANLVHTLLGSLSVGIFDKAVMHVPLETAEQARDHAKALGADCMVAIGGGSTVGLAKAVALVSDVPIIAIPTTYAGSEMTSIYGITEGGVKKTGRDNKVLPRTVIYDPRLSVSLPVDLSVTSAINAIAHAAEALYAHDTNPIINLMAQEGVRLAALSIPALMTNSQDLEARSQALQAAWLCGTVLGSVSMGLHHKLCHTLGGSFNLPHAQTHTVVLPHALAYNAKHAPNAMAALSQAFGGALGGANAPLAVYNLAKNNGAPTSLKALGMPESGLDKAADLAVSNQYPNPRPLERAALRTLLQHAFDGTPPTVE